MPAPRSAKAIEIESRQQGGPDENNPIAWRSVLSSALVFLFITLLVVVTTAVQIQSRNLQREIAGVLAPASATAKDTEVAIALQMTALQAYALTRDGQYLDAYDAAFADERKAIDRLTTYMPDLEPIAGEHFQRLRSLLREWHTVLPLSSELDGSIGPGEGRHWVPLEQALYRETLAAAMALDQTISRAAIQRRANIDAAERIDWYFTIGLCIAVLAPALMLFWLNRRVRRMARDAEQRRLELERLMEARSGLMRGLSHDIRNPLGVVQGYAQILESGLKGELTAQQLDVVRRMNRAAGTSLTLLEGVLELAQAEAGRLTIHRELTDIHRIVSDAIDEQIEQALFAGITFDLEIAESIPSVITDRARVRRVIDNLLSNALKYAPRGSTVRVLVSLAGDRDSGDRISIHVRDRGAGIPENERERIFGEFYRIEGSERRAKGLGIGLAISRRIARLLGGDLTVEDVEGPGAAFVFWLPVQRAADSASDESAAFIISAELQAHSLN